MLDDLPAPTPRTVYDGNGVRRQVEDPPEVDWRFLQNLRSRLGSIAGRQMAVDRAARQGGRVSVSGVLEELALERERAVGKPQTSGAVGFEPVS